MLYRVLERRLVPSRGPVLADEVIELTSEHAAARCTVPLRRVVVWDATKAQELAFLTNIHHLAASTLAKIYKDRWQIELFFKALKQRLKIKTFVGTSENAVQIQIWTALIAMLLLRFLQLQSTWAWSLSNLGAMVRLNLLTYRDLWAWLDAPFEVPLRHPQEEQLTLPNSYIGQWRREPQIELGPLPVQYRQSTRA